MTTKVTPPMGIRAVICAVYGTLLERGPAPEDADRTWTQLWRSKLNRPPRVSLAEFNRSADLALHAEASLASARGVEAPAPYWPAVAMQLLPELREIASEEVADFLFTHAQLRRSVRLHPGAVQALQALHDRGILLGLLCNGHPHTTIELALALQSPETPVEPLLPAGEAHEIDPLEAAVQGLEIFTRPLCFWSYSHGFGKPNPHAFQHVATRLRARGVAVDEVLMVGETEEGDLKPARKFGWRTWHLTSDDRERPSAGNWAALARKYDLPILAAP